MHVIWLGLVCVIGLGLVWLLSDWHWCGCYWARIGVGVIELALVCVLLG